MKVLGLLGLPLLVIAVAVMVFAFGSLASPGTAQAAGDVGQIAIDGPETGRALVPDTGIGPIQVQIDGADVTIQFSDDAAVGLGPWTLDVTYDDRVVDKVNIGPAITTTNDGDIGKHTSLSSTIGDSGDGVEFGPATSPTAVIDEYGYGGFSGGAAITTTNDESTGGVVDFSAAPTEVSSMTMAVTLGLALLTVGALAIFGLGLGSAKRSLFGHAAAMNTIGVEGTRTDQRTGLRAMGRVALHSVDSRFRTLLSSATQHDDDPLTGTRAGT